MKRICASVGLFCIVLFETCLWTLCHLKDWELSDGTKVYLCLNTAFLMAVSAIVGWVCFSELTSDESPPVPPVADCAASSPPSAQEAAGGTRED